MIHFQIQHTEKGPNGPLSLYIKSIIT